MNIQHKKHKVRPDKWARYKYSLSTGLGAEGKPITGCPEHIALSCKVATEGMVLLENRR